MKTLRIILIIFIISVFVSGCAAEPQFIAGEQETNSAFSDPDGVQNEELLDSTVLSGDELIKPYSSGNNTGSAKDLVGNNLIISVLVEDTESIINTQTETVILENMRKAADWLEAEAQKRKKTARIITGKEDSELVLRYKYSGVFPDSNYNYDDILLMMKNLKMGSLYGKMIEKYSDANIAVILFWNKPGYSVAFCGDSLAVPERMFADDPDPMDFGYLDICEIFSCQTIDETAFDPYVIAHELLHLYGAVDLYYVYSEYPQINEMRVEKSLIARNYMPNEIMLSLIPPNEISDLTAYLIGWEETVPIKYVYLLYDPQYGGSISY